MTICANKTCCASVVSKPTPLNLLLLLYHITKKGTPKRCAFSERCSLTIKGSCRLLILYHKKEKSTPLDLWCAYPFEKSSIL